MFDKILESKLEQLDDLMMISEVVYDKDALSLHKHTKEHDAPVYLYKTLHEIFLDPKFGSYLCPAKFIQQKSIFLSTYEMFYFDELMKKVPEESRHDKDIIATTQERAERLADTKIKQEREVAINDLLKDGKTREEAETIINRKMPFHSNLPSLTSLNVESQGNGSQEVFVAVSKMLPEIDPENAEIYERNKRSLKATQIASKKTIVSAVNVDNALHEVDYSRMVIFGDGNVIPDRQELEVGRIDFGIRSIESALEKAQDVKERNEYERKLLYEKNKRNQLAFGVWSPSDLNELIYGKSLLTDGAPDKNLIAEYNNSIKVYNKDLIARFGAGEMSSDDEWMYDEAQFAAGRGDDQRVVDYSTDIVAGIKARHPDRDFQHVGVLPNFYFMFGGSERSFLKRKEKSAKENKELYADAIDDWEKNFGDFTKIRSATYEMALRFFLDKVRGQKEIIEVDVRDEQNRKTGKKEKKVKLDSNGKTSYTYGLVKRKEEIANGLKEKLDVRSRSVLGSKFVIDTYIKNPNINLASLDEMYKSINYSGSIADVIEKYKAIHDENPNIGYVELLASINGTSTTEVSDILNKSKKLDGLLNEIKLLKGFVSPTEEDRITLTIGNITYKKSGESSMQEGWGPGRENMNPFDKTQPRNNLAMIFSADLTTSHNQGSILKRYDLANIIISCVDKCVFLWTTNKVMNAVYGCYENTMAGVLDNVIGSDPGLVNNFVCNMESYEEKYGLGAHLSWLLIPHIEMHTKRADAAFKECKVIYGEGSGSDFDGNFSKFAEGWSTGVDDGDVKPYYIDKRGRKINIYGEVNKDKFVQMVLAIGSDNGTIDLNAMTQRQLETQAAYDRIDELNDNKKETESQLMKIGFKLDAGSWVAGDGFGKNVKTKQAQHDLEVKTRSYVVDLNKAEEEIKELGDLIQKNDFETKAFWNDVLDQADDLQKKLGGNVNISKAEKLMKKRAKIKNVNEPEFEAWLKSSGKAAELEKLNSDVQARIEVSTDPKEAAAANMEYINKVNELKDEFITTTVESREIDPDIKKIILQVQSTHKTYDRTKIAKIANEIYNKDKEFSGKKITEEDVSEVLNPNDEDRKGDKQRNILKFMSRSLKDYVNSNAIDWEKDIISPKEVDKESPAGKIRKFIDGVAHSIAAMLEMKILTASRTKIFKGGGLKTHEVYVDDHGVLHMPPGVDSSVVFGAIHDTWDIVRAKQKEIADKSEQIENDEQKLASLPDNDDKSEKEMKLREDKKDLEIQKSVIDDYLNRMQRDDPATKKASVVANDISSSSNPLLGKNALAFDKLLKKMRENMSAEPGKTFDFNTPVRQITKNDRGELVEGETLTDAAGNPIREIDWIGFVHRNMPMMQTMCINMARVSGRYLTTQSKSVDTAGRQGSPPSNTKDITDLGAIQRGNACSNLINVLGAEAYHRKLKETFESNGLGDKLTELGIGENVVPYIAIECAYLANGVLMKGGVPQGREIIKQFIKTKLMNHTSSVTNKDFSKNRLDENIANIDKTEAVVGKIVNAMEEISVPDENDKAIANALFDSTMSLLQQIIDATILLHESDLEFNSSSGDVITNFLDSLKKTKDPEATDRIARDFFDYLEDVFSNKKSEAIYADVVGDMGNIDALDNLVYLAIKLEDTIRRTPKGEAGEQFIDEISKIRGDMKKIFNELKSDGYIFSPLASKDMVIASILSEAQTYREGIVKRLDSRIDLYEKQDEMSKVVDKLKEFSKVIDASKRYHTARGSLVEAKSNKDREKAKKAVELAKSDLLKQMESPDFKLAVSEADAHRMVPGKKYGSFKELQAAYKKRKELYDGIIFRRNRLIGSGGNIDEKREGFLSLYSALVNISKNHNMSGSEVAVEVSETFESQLERAGKSMKERTRAAEQATGNPEIEVVLSVSGDTKVIARVYPKPHDARYFYNNIGKTIDVTIHNPKKLLNDRKTEISAFIEISDEMNDKPGNVPPEVYGKDQETSDRPGSAGNIETGPKKEIKESTMTMIISGETSKALMPIENFNAVGDISLKMEIGNPTITPKT